MSRRHETDPPLSFTCASCQAKYPTLDEALACRCKSQDGSACG